MKKEYTGLDPDLLAKLRGGLQEEQTKRLENELKIKTKDSALQQFLLHQEQLNFEAHN
jgi:hypothetical protein